MRGHGYGEEGRERWPLKLGLYTDNVSPVRKLVERGRTDQTGWFNVECKRKEGAKKNV